MRGEVWFLTKLRFESKLNDNLTKSVKHLQFCNEINTFNDINNLLTF